MKTITPIIKKTRTITEEYDVCPHCQKEIQEKSVFAENNYLYHRGCVEKGPIDELKPPSKEELVKLLGWGK